MRLSWDQRGVSSSDSSRALRSKKYRIGPLSESERLLADQVAARLLPELRDLISLLPPEKRGASVLSRFLSVDRATCQRTVAAVSSQKCDAQVLVRLPGVEGLRRFVEPFKSRLAHQRSEELIDSVLASINDLERVIDSLAGSQRRLAARLDAHVIPSRTRTSLPADDARIREQHFRTAAAIAGRWSDVAIHVRALIPSDVAPDTYACLRLRGQIGMETAPNAAPFEVGELATSTVLQVPDSKVLSLSNQRLSSQTDGAFLEDFCSKPLPKIISRTADRGVIHVIDSADALDRPIDVVMAVRTGLYQRLKPEALGKSTQVWWIQQIPARALIFDVWLHESLSDPSGLQISQHLWTPDFGSIVMNRWSTQLPSQLDIEHLGRGLSHSKNPAYPRMRDLLFSFMSHGKLHPDEMVGYRLHVAYPIWRIGYCMAFHFGKPPKDHPPT